MSNARPFFPSRKKPLHNPIHSPQPVNYKSPRPYRTCRHQLRDNATIPRLPPHDLLADQVAIPGPTAERKDVEPARIADLDEPYRREHVKRGKRRLGVDGSTNPKARTRTS
jgi:hypothetical protein